MIWYNRIEEKIATKNISPDKISDYLGGRLMFKNFNDLKLLLDKNFSKKMRQKKWKK